MKLKEDLVQMYREGKVGIRYISNGENFRTLAEIHGKAMWCEKDYYFMGQGCDGIHTNDTTGKFLLPVTAFVDNTVSYPEGVTYPKPWWWKMHEIISSIHTQDDVLAPVAQTEYSLKVGDVVEVSNNGKYWDKGEYQFYKSGSKYPFGVKPYKNINSTRGYKHMRLVEAPSTVANNLWEPKNGEEVECSINGKWWMDGIYIGKNTSITHKELYPHITSNSLGLINKWKLIRPKREVITKAEAEKRLNVKIEG